MEKHTKVILMCLCLLVGIFMGISITKLHYDRIIDELFVNIKERDKNFNELSKTIIELNKVHISFIPNEIGITEKEDTCNFY